MALRFSKNDQKPKEDAYCSIRLLYSQDKRKMFSLVCKQTLTSKATNTIFFSLVARRSKIKIEFRKSHFLGKIYFTTFLSFTSHAKTTMCFVSYSFCQRTKIRIIFLFFFSYHFTSESYIYGVYVMYTRTHIHTYQRKLYTI